MELKQNVIERLKTVIDPGTNIDVVAMGLIKDLEVEPGTGKVSLKFRPSVSLCPMGFKLAFDIRDAVKEIDGVKKVDLEVIDFIHAAKVNKMLLED
ncbi:MAG: DUF59 domain-containing protein [Candidatus Omnitrophica bacterium]|nr:DUF59 domain-containing protein [Candidatus Omnitrophota bacterium]